MAQGALGALGTAFVGVVSQKGKIAEAITGAVSETIGDAVSKSAEGLTKSFSKKFELANQARTALASGQSALNEWKASFVQRVHDKFSTIENITSTIHKLDNWDDEDDPDEAITLAEKLKRMNNRIKALELKANASPPPTPPKEEEQPVQGSYSDVQDNKKAIESLRKKVFVLLQKIAPLSADKSISILRQDGEFDQLDDFSLAMSERVRELEDSVREIKELPGGSGSGVRVTYTTGERPLTTRDFNPNNCTLFPDLR